MKINLSTKARIILGVSAAAIAIPALIIGGRKLVRFVKDDMAERDCDNLMEYAMDRILGRSSEDEDFDEDEFEGGPMGEACDG